MGSWHGTCGLTNLPITSGDEMFVFPILETHSDSMCYSTALYRPSVLPFRAKYNDYGAGEENHGVGLDILIDGIRKQLIELEVGENTYHDIAVKKKDFNVHTFFEACHKGRLFFDNPMRGYHPEQPRIGVFFTMIRKDVVERLWSEWKFDMWKPKHLRQGSNDYYEKDMTYARLADIIPEYMEHCATRDKNSIKIANLVKFTSEKVYSDEQLPILDDYFTRYNFFNQNQDHLLSGSFGHAFDGAGYSGGGFARFADVKDHVLDHYLSGDKETAYELMRECLIGIMINSFMECIRKVWLPPMHQGSQSECYDEYKLFYTISNDVIKERESIFDEYK